MKKTYIYIITLACLSLCSCSSDEENEPTTLQIETTSENYITESMSTEDCVIGEMTTVDEIESTTVYGEINNTPDNISSTEVVATIPVQGDGLDYEYQETYKLRLPPLEFNVLPEGGFIILSPKGDYVVKCSVDNVTTRIDLSGHEFVNIYFTKSNQIILKDVNRLYYILHDDGTLELVEKNDIEIKSICHEDWNAEAATDLVKNNWTKSVLRVDSEGNIYVYEEREDRCICKYDCNGELKEYAAFFNDNCVAYISIPVSVDENGNTYIMQCYEDKFLIKKVTLGRVE